MSHLSCWLRRFGELLAHDNGVLLRAQDALGLGGEMHVIGAVGRRLHFLGPRWPSLSLRPPFAHPLPCQNRPAPPTRTPPSHTLASRSPLPTPHPLPHRLLRLHNPSPTAPNTHPTRPPPEQVRLCRTPNRRGTTPYPRAAVQAAARRGPAAPASRRSPSLGRSAA